MKGSELRGSIRVGLGITCGVWEAAFWGFVGGFALLVGAGLGLIWRTPPRVVGIVMAFGAGVLISTVAFELVDEAFDASGALPVVVGLVAGALTFYLGDLIGAPPVTIAVTQAFAAGAILTMLADTMMPEGFANAGNSVGLVTCAGFISAFLLSHLS
ncbi:MAG: hypothetical protein ABR608_13615 [Pseudonocardiaceae bacterium]